MSRTPLREALNRLTTEGFLKFTPGKEFFCRELNAHEIFDLYEFRKAIEVASVRLAIKRAADADISALLAFLDGPVRSRVRARRSNWSSSIISALNEGYAQIYMGPAAVLLQTS